MNIEEVREKALKEITSVVDPEWHGEGYPTKAEIIYDLLISIPLSEGKVCDECFGLSIMFAGGRCACCEGTRWEVLPITIASLIEEKLNE